MTIRANLHYEDGRVVEASWTPELQERISAPGGNPGLREIWLDDGAGWHLAFARDSDDDAFDEVAETERDERSGAVDVR